MESVRAKLLGLLLGSIVGVYALPVFAVKAGDSLYTAHNIWELTGRNMAFINYKFKTSFIPTGSKVVINDVDDGLPSIDVLSLNQGSQQPSVTFTVADTGKRYTMNFHAKYQRGTQFSDALARTFGDKDFEALTKGFSKQEIKAIRKGVLTYGMSKKAVLVSYGYPPSHRTASLSSNE